MPVSTITSQARPGAASFQRATCSGVLSTGRALLAKAAAEVVRPNAMQDAQLGAVGSGPSASASAQVETKKSRQPASASKPRHLDARQAHSHRP